MCTGTLVAEEIPNLTAWAESGHNDAEAEAFIHWGYEPNTVSTRCAKCHSTPGYLDFLGADGTTEGVVDNAPNVGTTITCVACHNEVTAAMDSVLFPSGIEVTGLDSAEARCMQCHQGRESGVSVDNAIADANVIDDDDPNASLGFKNVHYFAAGATQMGSEAHGGYQYDGKSYDIKFTHVEGLGTCNSCHNPHSLEVEVNICGDCHEGVVTAEDLNDIRFLGSASDYDGDGDEEEGIYGEIEDLKMLLYATMQTYATSIGNPIIYDSHSYPYFFKDTNGNGQVDPGEANYGNRYQPWTARLLRAAYNYQVSLKDPGGYAHNAKYIIQLLYDSIEDLGGDVSGLHRDDPGHFAGSHEAFRHWDEDGDVSASCSKCHSAAGLPLYLEDKVTTSQPIANGLMCSTCHDSMPEFTLREAGEVEFPSGAELTMNFDSEDPNYPDAVDNLCINCHQGRQSTASVNDYIEGRPIDTVSSSMSFRNVHYMPAGATLFGANAKSAYEYTGKVYNGRFRHTGFYDTCIKCHQGGYWEAERSHTFEVLNNVGAEDNCWCHDEETPDEFRKSYYSGSDYDGDGSTTEGLSAEVSTLHDTLYEAIQNYATNVCGTSIGYASSYPYFFVDTNGNGQIDPGEDVRANGFRAFTPRLIQATYNYQYIKKDHGAYAHNGKYAMQILYDSVESLGNRLALDIELMGIVRPGAANTVDVCGDATHPYPEGDINQDCLVNFGDFVIFGSRWFENSGP